MLLHIISTKQKQNQEITNEPFHLTVVSVS